MLSRHDHFDRAAVILNRDVCHAPAELAVQRPCDRIVKFKADGAGLRGDEIVLVGEVHPQQLRRHGAEIREIFDVADQHDLVKPVVHADPKLADGPRRLEPAN